MKLDINAIKQLVEKRLVNAQRHPSFPLTIYKYTPGAVFEGEWSELLLRCRGVVCDDDGEIVVNGFIKFFNHSEPAGKDGYESRKGTMAYSVTEKLDGSLIQVAWWNGNLIVTSSGSFGSPQAQKGTDFLKRFGYLDFIEEGKTYLFEIIYPENRIVINYGDKEALTLLAIRETETGQDIFLDPRFNFVAHTDLSLSEIEASLSRPDYINKEGFIVLFQDGHRVKLKYAEYMRLHKIVSGVNEKFVWEAMRDGVDLDKALKGVPDELFNFVKDTKANLQFEYYGVQVMAKNAFEAVKGLPTRKEQAIEIMAKHKKYSQVIFAMLDGKPYEGAIWKLIEPQKVSRLGTGEVA